MRRSLSILVATAIVAGSAASGLTPVQAAPMAPAIQTPTQMSKDSNVVEVRSKKKRWRHHNRHHQRHHHHRRHHRGHTISPFFALPFAFAPFYAQPRYQDCFRRNGHLYCRY
jgi:hypothetical protein